MKQRPQRLVSAIRNALNSATERARRQRAEEELKKIEEQFLRAQRLENLGMLVTGIAHDLNNMLVPVIIGIELLKTEPLSEDASAMLQTMETSARRSADIVKQMLAFARGGEASKTLIYADGLVREMGKVIAETFPKFIQRRILIGKNSHPIFAIPTQIHQVLMNLCVNARDAMPNGGTLTLTTGNAVLAAREAAKLGGAKGGNYLCISIADTGTDISAEQLGKIFQPFFTTKGPGKGTGPGLSTSGTLSRTTTASSPSTAGSISEPSLKFICRPALPGRLKQPRQNCRCLPAPGNGF